MCSGSAVPGNTTAEGGGNTLSAPTARSMRCRKLIAHHLLPPDVHNVVARPSEGKKAVPARHPARLVVGWDASSLTSRSFAQLHAMTPGSYRSRVVCAALPPARGERNVTTRRRRSALLHHPGSGADLQRRHPARSLLAGDYPRLLDRVGGYARVGLSPHRCRDGLQPRRDERAAAIGFARPDVNKTPRGL